MILELRVTLLYEEKPVWRRLRVDDRMSFLGLHEVLQVAFDWTNSHLHHFMIYQSGGLEDETSIGMEDDDSLYEGSFERKEKDESVGDWLNRVNDHAVYVYDFGDNWAHEIVVENVYEHDEETVVPYCVEVMGTAPDEDSRGEVNDAGRISNDELLKKINHLFSEGYHQTLGSYDTFFDPEIEDEEEMEPSYDLIQLMKDLHNAAPWEVLHSDQVFAIDQQGFMVFVSVMGAAEMEKGLAIYPSMEGWRTLSSLFREEDEEYRYKQFAITATFNDRNELDPIDYGLVKDTGIPFRGKGRWPMFRSYEPGYIPWYLNEHEKSLVTFVVRHVLDVTKRIREGLEVIAPFETGYMYTRVAGDGFYEEHGVEITEFDRMLEEEQQSIENELLIKQLQAIPVVDDQIEFVGTYTSQPIVEKPGDRPFFGLIVAGYSKKNGLFLVNETYGPIPKTLALQDAFCKMVIEQNAMPAQVTITHTDYKYLERFFNALPVKVRKVKEIGRFRMFGVL
ncbi:plasmid pRiA4b ORF-3 family protein [Jeotgalibacillus sp. R-1-5s-1]|uniref:plasmid pRiA4b ORF-3 family protein n=1 Tax=Jeotgalibacillus sp. R-1-5s-1 TaxID=2555897 RepID=UPI00106A69E3|nr:plasmid pRiA4b ORF-3 family protein [Jeotgalibacillus sp. R-1-5s-1]TFD97068.1 plasmid pRiA4b ORF-3 family protein [Jeotgalibacillus sp. R-1-5s-1]